jgi:hypothetical protein
MDAVLQHDPVTDQVEAEPGSLSLAPDGGIGEPDRRHQGRAGRARPVPRRRSGVKCVHIHRALGRVNVSRRHCPGPFNEGEMRVKPLAGSA